MSAPSRAWSRLGACLLGAVLASGCAKPHTPRGVAETFIDRYYIERDHARALAMATGIAASRVAQEKNLVEEGQAAGAGASAVQPHIYYSYRKTTPKGADQELSYALTIDSGGVPLHKDLRIVVTPNGADWKVSFFNETDMQ
jgi:hypothetical protein